MRGQMARRVLWSASMRTSLFIFTFIGALGAAGCDGAFVSSAVADAGVDPNGAATAMFSAQILPMMNQACAACHVGTDAVGFMRPDPDVLTTMMGHPNLVVGGDPGASRLYAYGRSDQHSGISFNVDQAELVRQWIELVPPSEPPPPQVETTKFSPLLGGQVNSVDLSTLAAGLEGATLTFKANQLAQGIYVTELTVNAGAGGVHIAHPLFVSHCPQTLPDPVDSFYGLDLVVNPGESSPVSGGTVVLVDFSPGCKMSVHFKLIEPGVAGPGEPDAGGPVGGGCVNVGGFTANARGPIEQQCASCHAGGNATARNAWDVSAIADLSPAAQAAVCAQTRNKINLENEPQSLLFQRVAPGQQTGHPIALQNGPFTAFRDPIVNWAVTE